MIIVVNVIVNAGDADEAERADDTLDNDGGDDDDNHDGIGAYEHDHEHLVHLR